MSKNTTSDGRVIDLRKLKSDDRLYLKWLSDEEEKQQFIDDCVATYLRAWSIDLTYIKKGN